MSLTDPPKAKLRRERHNVIRTDAMTTGWNAIEGIERSMVESDGIRYHTVRAGSGTPVVLLAGFPQSSYAWRRVLPRLAVRHRVIAIDLPGQGDSDKPIDGYDTKTTAD